MDELPKRVLYAFYPDRILQFEQIVELSNTSLPFVRNTINKVFIPLNYVEEIYVPKQGQKHDYFRLTHAGRKIAAEVHLQRMQLSNRIAALVADGMSVVEAAQQAASESVKTDNP